MPVLQAFHHGAVLHSGLAGIKRLGGEEMVREESDCVGCALPCIGDECAYRRIRVTYCDRCGEEDDLYEFEGRQLCIGCVRRSLTKVDAWAGD